MTPTKAMSDNSCEDGEGLSALSPKISNYTGLIKIEYIHSGCETVHCARYKPVVGQFELSLTTACILEAQLTLA